MQEARDSDQSYAGPFEQQLRILLCPGVGAFGNFFYAQARSPINAADELRNDGLVMPGAAA
jgi:hypothetical protein